jgi:hypothetical protein
MSRSCRTCQHLKRSEIDRRLAAGEPSVQVARDYELSPSSLHRHRTNCLKLGSSNAIKKDAARGTAAVALLPSKENLSDAYFELRLAYHAPCWHGPLGIRISSNGSEFGSGRGSSASRDPK